MPTLEGESQHIELRGLGTYPLPEPEGAAAPGVGGVTWTSSASVIVNLIGDFLAAKRCDVAAAASGRLAKLNGRKLLGGIERLRDGDVILIDHAAAGTTGGASRARYVYRQAAPPIELIVPPDERAELRCAYSGESLVGRTAIRCGRCCALYDTNVWCEDLAQSCVLCGWPGDGVRSGALR